MKKINLFFLSVLALVIFTSAIQFNKPNNSGLIIEKTIKLGTYEDVSATDFKKMVDSKKYILVDVRTLNEFKAAHIEGAVNIDWYQRTFEANIQKLDKTKAILIYCRSGNRTSKTKFAMLGMGFQKVYNLQYGVNDWAKNKYPFVK